MLAVKAQELSGGHLGWRMLTLWFMCYVKIAFVLFYSFLLHNNSII